MTPLPDLPAALRRRVCGPLTLLLLCLWPCLCLTATEPTTAAQERERTRCLARLGADRWQAAGFRGQGVKIAILDTGFRGYRNHLGKALPTTVLVRSFRADGDLEARNSQHGILCGEVIHAIAPETDLLFANWDIGNADQYLAAVRWARARGARVLRNGRGLPAADAMQRGRLVPSPPSFRADTLSLDFRGHGVVRLPFVLEI
jgi:hypothetical protein